MSSFMLLLITLAVCLLIYLGDENRKSSSQQKVDMYDILPSVLRPDGYFQVDSDWLSSKFRFIYKYYDEYLIKTCFYDGERDIYHIYLELINLKPEYKVQLEKLPELFEKYTEKILLGRISNVSDLVFYASFYDAFTVNVHLMVGNSDNARQYIRNLKLERQRQRLPEEQKIDEQIESRENEIQKSIIQKLRDM